MADLPSAPVVQPVVGQGGQNDERWVQWIRALERKIKELETRLAALE